MPHHDPTEFPETDPYKRVTDQEQAPLDSALLDRVQAMAKRDRDTGDGESLVSSAVLYDLVAALKAAQQRYQTLLELARVESTWRDAIDEVLQLRDDLARVEADAKKWQEEAEQIHREDTELESRYEAALARIADLEVAVDMTPDYLGRTKLVYATEVIGLRKDLATERNRIAELEGSLRECIELYATSPYEAKERARAVLAQTPSAS